MGDLKLVRDKMDLCQALLKPSASQPLPSLHQDQQLLEVIGFLEACAPRMIELVEAAAQGALQEKALEECLVVNDRLTKLLADVETAALTETPASTTVASAAGSMETVEQDLLFAENDVDDVTPTTGSSTSRTTANTGKSDDPFAAGVFRSEPAGSSDTNHTAIPAVQGSKSDDEFDAFFNERATTGN